MKKIVKALIGCFTIAGMCICGVSAKDYVSFGSYPQSEVSETAALKTATYDNDGDTEINGTRYRRLTDEEGYRYFLYEPILWEQIGNEYISRFVLDCEMYDAQETKIKEWGASGIEYASSTSWEKCSLRTWLNDTFYTDAFTDAEKENLIPDGNYVKLLAPDVAKTVVTDRNLSKKCTDYARAKGVEESVGSLYNGNCEWFLRDVSKVTESTVCTVTPEGKVNTGITVLVNNSETGVVPCIQLKTVGNTVHIDEVDTTLVYAPYGKVLLIDKTQLDAYLSVGWYRTKEEAEENLYPLINERFKNSSIYEAYKPYVTRYAKKLYPSISMEYPVKNPTAEELLTFLAPLKKEFFTGRQEDFIQIYLSLVFDKVEGKDEFDIVDEKIKNAIELLYPSWGPLISSGSAGSTSIHHNFDNTFNTSLTLRINGSGGMSIDETEYFDKLAELAALAKQYSDRPLGQLQYIRNHLAENAVYDSAQFHNNPTSLLLDGVGVCGNYAIAVKDLCTFLGIPCLNLTNSKMSHAWNCVYLEGKWYELDTTGIEHSAFFAGDEYYEFDANGFPASVTAESVDFLSEVTYTGLPGSHVSLTALQSAQAAAMQLPAIALPSVPTTQPVQPTVKTDVQVYINGEKLVTDSPILIENGRTLVPMRAIFEALGATVYWNGDTQTATAVNGVDVVTIQINNKVMTKNGQNITLDVPAVIRDARTLVPARAVSESFRMKVDWDASARAVYIQE
ncbi:MAG: hypothetical protein E7397_03990 [Ruminococcaceae bacterium]|nr:hypothetical protein [Oscillospiraceae bacterium]